MQPVGDGRALALNVVRERMRRRKLYDGTALAKAAGLNADTANDFLSGKRWPRRDTLTKIEAALGMETGEIAALNDGDATFAASHATAVSSAKSLDEASEVELIMELLSRATARLADG